MTGRPDSYMPIFITDYLGDTRHLSMAEHGAYLLLMFQYWRTAKPLPDDNTILARLCAATVTDWETVSVTVREFFKPAVINGRKVLTHKRIEQELDKARSNYEKRVAASARANKAKNDAFARLKTAKVIEPDTDVVTATVTEPETEPETVTVTQLRTQNSKSKEDLEGSAPAAPTPKPKSENGRRWGSAEQIPPNWLLDAEKERDDANLPRINLVLEAKKFANHWASKAGKNATHTDWKRTWINWALNAYGAKPMNGESKSWQTVPESGKRKGVEAALAELAASKKQMQ